MRGFYARDAGAAEAMRGHLVEAGLQVEPVAQVDLFDEGLSLGSRKAFRVSVAEADHERAAQVLAERASGLIEWTEDLSHLSPLPPLSEEPIASSAPAPPAGRRQDWKSDPTSWSDDLFSGDEGLSESVLAWLESSAVPTAPQLGKALERAIRADREDLVWPLCRFLKPVVVDTLERGRIESHVKDLVHTVFEASSPGVVKMIEDLVELAWDPSPSVRRIFCLAAGQLSAEPLLPPLVSLLADPDEEVRYEASGALYGLVHLEFGFDSEASAEERALAVARWNEWLAARYGGTSWSS